MSNPPSGTVTFLFTDIEGSTKRWEQYPQQMQAALARHDHMLRTAIEAQGGHIFKTMGDAFYAAFHTPLEALSAALAAQQVLNGEQWDPEIGAMRVRMALHTGMVEMRDSDYFGQPLNRVARLLSAGHGGQTLLSQPIYDLVRDTLPAGVTLLDLGEHRLKDLIRPEHVFQVVATDLLSEFPPLKTLDARPNNLPRQATALIGREKEIEGVCALLRRPDTALITLTGPGGMGKTRLSLQVGAELLEDFSDGVWFVELAALLEHKLVVHTIAQTLGVKEAGSTPIIETLKEYLKDKRLLLILDNFEQVTEAAPQVGQLLTSCPNLKVLATSRIPLRVRGEREHAVPPLSLPDLHHLPPLGAGLVSALTQYEAVKLFIERAVDVKSDFEVTNDNAPAVAEICARLDGLPLAIELAAARIRMLPPHALLARLDRRLKVLTGGAQDLPARQQTLRNTIEWSYDLLEEGEKQLFTRMAVFQGGRTLEGLEAVCNWDGQLELDVLDGVGSLVSKSLLQQREGRDGEVDTRFWMLETIHEYAREKLAESGETAALGKEHAHYFMRLAEEAEPHLTGAKQVEWLDRLEDEYDNMRAALDWALDKGRQEAERGRKDDSELGLRLAGALQEFWSVRGYFIEGSRRFEQVLESSEGREGGNSDRGEAALRAKGYSGAGTLAWQQGDFQRAQALHSEALALYRQVGDKKGAAFSLNNVAAQMYRQGEYERAQAVFEESLALYRELEDKQGMALVLNNLGNVAASVQEDYQVARSLFEESLSIFRELGNKGGITLALGNLGIVAYMQGDYQVARPLFEESLSRSRELGDKRLIARSLLYLGNLAHSEDEYVSAHLFYRQALTIHREIGDKHGIALTLGGLGVAISAMGEPYRGAKLLGGAEALLEAVGSVLELDDRIVYEQGIASARARLGEEAFERAWAEGRGMSMEQAIEYALEGQAK